MRILRDGDGHEAGSDGGTEKGGSGELPQSQSSLTLVEKSGDEDNGESQNKKSTGHRG